MSVTFPVSAVFGWSGGEVVGGPASGANDSGDGAGLGAARNRVAPPLLRGPVPSEQGGIVGGAAQGGRKPALLMGLDRTWAHEPPWRTKTLLLALLLPRPSCPSAVALILRGSSLISTLSLPPFSPHTRFSPFHSPFPSLFTRSFCAPSGPLNNCISVSG